MMYWGMFFFGTFVALLIILNMVIAVMSASFAKVEEANAAHIMREKLEVIIQNWFRIPESYKKECTKSKYLVVINIDPVNDSIEDETSEHRIRAAIENMNQRVK